MLNDRELDISFSGRTIFGARSIYRAGEIAASLKATRAFLVTDPGVAANGISGLVVDALEESGIDTTVFDAVTPNPTVSDVESGAAILRELGSGDTVVVGVGGGSAMDAAKCIALQATNGGSATDLDFRNEPEHDGLTVIAVPTTAGTGAETNGFGVVTDPLAGRKFYAGHDSVKPAAAILDPELTTGLPPGATAATGVDALVHALESLMSSSANPYADGLALQVIRMVHDWLPAAVEDGNDLEARSQMLLAAHLAGLAFASGTGLGLCHALAHPLGARVEAVHGLALGAVLPGVLRFNLATSADKLALVARSLGVGDASAGERESAEAAIQALEALVTGVLDDISIPLPNERDALDGLVLANTPRQPSAAEVEELLSAVR
jgi:alcohol dehydrogenase